MRIQNILKIMLTLTLIATFGFCYVQGAVLNAPTTANNPTLDGTPWSDEWVDAEKITLSNNPVVAIQAMKQPFGNGYWLLLSGLVDDNTVSAARDAIYLYFDVNYNSLLDNNDLECMMTRGGTVKQYRYNNANWIEEALGFCSGISVKSDATKWTFEMVSIVGIDPVSKYKMGFMADVVDYGNNEWKWPTNANYIHVNSWGTLLISNPAPKVIITKNAQTAPSNHDWSTTLDDGYNEMAQFTLVNEATENVQIHSITLDAEGNLDVSTKVTKAIIAVDVDKDGKYNPQVDMKLGEGVYTQPFGSVKIDVPWQDAQIVPGAGLTIVISYVMNPTAEVGKQTWFSITEVTGFGQSGAAIEVLTPVTGAVKTIIAASQQQCANQCGANEDQKPFPDCTCTPKQPVIDYGALQFVVSPTVISNPQYVTASISGLKNSNGKVVLISKYNCNGEIVATCTLANNVCSKTFQSPQTPGTYIYFACADLNGDGIYSDIKEWNYASIKLSGGQTTCTKDNCGGCATKTTCETATCEWNQQYSACIQKFTTSQCSQWASQGRCEYYGCHWCSNACRETTCGSITPPADQQNGTGTNGSTTGSQQGTAPDNTLYYLITAIVIVAIIAVAYVVKKK